MKRRIHSTRRPPRGISLLDTLCVVTIASSVSAVALPKFTELPGLARASVVTSMAGAVRSASTLVHMKCAVRADCPLYAGESDVVVAGDAVRLVHGYPKGGQADGIENAVEYTGFTPSRGTGRTAFLLDGAPNAQACAVIYQEPPGTGRTPEVQTITTGC